MSEYKCTVCQYIYNENDEEISFDDLSNDWKCPICNSSKDAFVLEDKNISFEIRKKYEDEHKEVYETYRDLKHMAYTGESVVKSMGSLKELPFNFNDLNFVPAQIYKVPLNKEESVDSKFVFGKSADKPLVLDSPILMSAISYGAVSAKVRQIISEVARVNNIGFNTGEGGVLDSDVRPDSPVIIQYATGRFGVSEELLGKASAIEIKIGQGAYPGKGSFLPHDKIDADLAKIRGLGSGEDAYSPARHPDINNHEELNAKVRYLKDVGGGVPVGAKIACGDIERDITTLVDAGVDFITIDGFGGGTGATNSFIRDNVGIPLIAGLPRAVKCLEGLGVRDSITLMVSGTLRTSADVGKALALGADGVYLGTTTLIGLGCQQYRQCHEGTCSNGIATSDSKLIENLEFEFSVKTLTNLMLVLNEELRMLARVMGKDSVGSFTCDDLVSLNRDLADVLGVKWLMG